MCRAVAAVLIAGVAGCQSTPEYPPTAEGHYMAQCSRCHEADGSSITASDLAEFRVDLRDPLFQREVGDAELREIILHGRGKMQGIDLSDAVIDSIVVHVRTLGR